MSAFLHVQVTSSTQAEVRKTGPVVQRPMEDQPFKNRSVEFTLSNKIIFVLVLPQDSPLMTFQSIMRDSIFWTCQAKCQAGSLLARQGCNRMAGVVHACRQEMVEGCHIEFSVMSTPPHIRGSLRNTCCMCSLMAETGGRTPRLQLVIKIYGPQSAQRHRSRAWRILNHV